MDFKPVWIYRPQKLTLSLFYYMQTRILRSLNQVVAIYSTRRLVSVF